MASFCKSLCLSDSESEELLRFSSELSDSDCNILDSVSSGDSECNFSREVPPRKSFRSDPLFDWRYTDFRPTVHEFKSDVSGISVNCSILLTSVEIFLHYQTDEICLLKNYLQKDADFNSLV
jgi:hypothetical protein